jgi:sialic acid synthase SpsE
MTIAGRAIGLDHPPFVIAEIGINHEGDIGKAMRMIDDAAASGCECVKFQSHVIEDEMIPNDVVPGNATESIWDIMKRCALSEDEEMRVKEYAESKGMIYMCTPFSRAAAVRLEKMNVPAYKIGSGECNNYPLIEHIAGYGKPIILSTGMNDIDSVSKAVDILRRHSVPFALLHCTSMYPTPYHKVRLGALSELAAAFPDAVLGLSDHSLGIHTCLGAVPLGARILEKHFTSDKDWPGPDVPISIDPVELRDMIVGSAAIHQALGGGKTILPEEQPTIDFAYACVVATGAAAVAWNYFDGGYFTATPKAKLYQYSLHSFSEHPWRAILDEGPAAFSSNAARKRIPDSLGDEGGFPLLPYFTPPAYGAVLRVAHDEGSASTINRVQSGALGLLMEWGVAGTMIMLIILGILMHHVLLIWRGSAEHARRAVALAAFFMLPTLLTTLVFRPYFEYPDVMATTCLLFLLSLSPASSGLDSAIQMPTTSR